MMTTAEREFLDGHYASLAQADGFNAIYKAVEEVTGAGEVMEWTNDNRLNHSGKTRKKKESERSTRKGRPPGSKNNKTNGGVSK